MLDSDARQLCPTVADIAPLPFAMESVATSIEDEIEKWPNLNAWSERTSERPAVKKAWSRVAEVGHQWWRE